MSEERAPFEHDDADLSVTYGSGLCFGSATPALAIYDLAYYMAATSGAGVGAYGEPVVLRLDGRRVRRFEWPVVQPPEEIGY